MEGFALPAKATGPSFWARLAAAAVGLVVVGIVAWLVWPSPSPPLPPALQPQGGVGDSPVSPIEAQQQAVPVPTGPEPRQLEARLEDIRSLVRAVPCSTLQFEMSEGIVRLHGYAHGEADVASLTQELKAQPGILGVVHSLSMLEDAHCQPIGVARAFVFAGLDAGSPLAIRPTRPVFETGDPLMLDIIGGDKNAYITVDYYDVYGNVVHMLPRPGATDTYLKAGDRIRLGSGGKNGEWGVSPPYGRDLALVIATPEPLYRRPRKTQVEVASDYLSDLQGRLDGLAERYGPGAITAGYALVTTQPKDQR